MPVHVIGKNQIHLFRCLYRFSRILPLIFQWTVNYSSRAILLLSSHVCDWFSLCGMSLVNKLHPSHNLLSPIECANEYMQINIIRTTITQGLVEFRGRTQYFLQYYKEAAYSFVTSFDLCTSQSCSEVIY